MMKYIIAIFLLLSCKISHAQVTAAGAATNEEAVVYQFNPAPNSNIVFIGNTFAVRLRQFNYFETLLYKSFPERDLTVRNLGWGADEVSLRPRPRGFGTLNEYLFGLKADVIFAFFGMNEAFKGPGNLDNFKNELATFIQELKQHKYNQEASPKIILVSPVPHEDLDGILSDPVNHNENLGLYTEEMNRIAEESGIPFVNLYAPTKKIMNRIPGPLTTDGIHLNDRGYKVVSEIMAQALDFPVSSWVKNSHYSELKEVIRAKNELFFRWFRPVNDEYIYGSRRGWPGGESLPPEFVKLESMIQRMDSIIWAGSNDGANIDMEEVGRIIDDPDVESAVLKDSSDNNKIAITEQFDMQEGYEINLFASAEDFPIANPVAIAFDPQGRMWVASMPAYPQYYPGRPPNGKIVILADTNHDGKADKSTTFADSLYLPLGFAVGDGGVYVTQLPNLVFMRDTDGDGHADSTRIVLQGFGMEDSHHALSAFTWGPDGALYMHEGTFLHSQVETPYGPVRGAYGTTWRYKPRTMKLDAYISYPYANPWGNVFARNGTHLIGDVSTGMNYFATPLTVAIDYPKKHVMMRDFLTAEILPKTCGMEIISSRAFPDSVQGDILFNTFIGFQGVQQHVLSKNANGMIVGRKAEPLLQSMDPRFRPVDLEFGPDGALYVADWHDQIIQHGEVNFRAPKRDHSHGRIWRVTHKNIDVRAPVDLTRLSIHELLDKLKAHENSVRYRTRVQLRQFSEDEVLPALETWLEQLNPKDPDYEHYRLEGLWVYQQFNHPNEELLNELLHSDDYNIRAAATRVLFYWSDSISQSREKLISMTKDSVARVRVEAIAALSHFESEATVKALLDATELPMGPYIDYALTESFRHLRPVWMKMFKDDPNFLADDPEKARFLLASVSSKQSLALPGFIPTNTPEGSKHLRQPLSHQDYRDLSIATAVVRFRISQKGVPDSVRKAGIQMLVERTGKDPVDVILDAIVRLDDEKEDHGLSELLRLLLRQDHDQIKGRTNRLARLAAKAKKDQVREVCIAVLNDLRQDISSSWRAAQSSADPLEDFIGSAEWVETDKVKSAMYDKIVAVLNGNTEAEFNSEERREIFQSAIHALAFIDNKTNEVVEVLGRYIRPKGEWAEEAAGALRSIPNQRLAMANLDQLKNSFIEIIQWKANRGEAQSISDDVVEGARKVARLLPEEEAGSLLNTLVKAETKTIHITTVPGEMRFDIEEFSVVAGQPVEIVFANPDRMVHNLLVLQPGSLKEVGKMADNMAQSSNGYEKDFIPSSDKVLFYSPLIKSGQTYSITFIAPDQKGEYPFACTFPGHWRTMNGVMKVVAPSTASTATN